VRRPSWSPDGDYLACANAINHGVHVTAVLQRSKWNNSSKTTQLVGHKGPVCVAKFCPILLRDASNNENSEDEEDKEEPASEDRLFASVIPIEGLDVTDSPDESSKGKRRPNRKEPKVHHAIALGGNDGRVSIWVIRKRPLLILDALFDSEILDLTWSPDGKVLLACAREGRIGGIHIANRQFFATDGPGHRIKGLNSKSLRERLRRNGLDPARMEAVDHANLLRNNGMAPPTAVPVAPHLRNPQRVTTMKDGRKRIQPTLIATISVPTTSPQPPGQSLNLSSTTHSYRVNSPVVTKTTTTTSITNSSNPVNRSTKTSSSSPIPSYPSAMFLPLDPWDIKGAKVFEYSKFDLTIKFSHDGPSTLSIVGPGRQLLLADLCLDSPLHTVCIPPTKAHLYLLSSRGTLMGIDPWMKRTFLNESIAHLLNEKDRKVVIEVSSDGLGTPIIVCSPSRRFKYHESLKAFCLDKK
jgi:hypothetical protein